MSRPKGIPTQVVHVYIPVSDLELIDHHYLSDNPNICDFMRLAVKEKLQQINSGNAIAPKLF